MPTTDSNDKAAAPEANHDEIHATPPDAVSARKIEANRQNAKSSTGPRTEEGKKKSAQNSVTHGIFVSQFLSGAGPDAINKMAALTDGLREHYQPIGMMENILVEKIVVETARYCRILGLEENELSRKYAFFGAAIDRVGRYSTSTSRALFRAIDQLERMQSERKAAENTSASSSRKSAGVPPSLPTTRNDL